ncbi:MAG: hypothetical protein O3A73_15110, partial [Proteobacteria bacterium]|nr:hypothetical protein [Pseudomonadota bacterium]
NLTRLIDWLQGLGARVDADIYPEARHEVLNETNRDEVISKLIDWLQVHHEIRSEALPLTAQRAVPEPGLKRR